MVGPNIIGGPDHFLIPTNFIVVIIRSTKITVFVTVHMGRSQNTVVAGATAAADTVNVVSLCDHNHGQS